MAPSNAPAGRRRGRVVGRVEHRARADAVTPRRGARQRGLLGQQRDAVQPQRRPRPQHDRRRPARPASQVGQARQPVAAALQPRQHLQRHLVDHPFAIERRQPASPVAEVHVQVRAPGAVIQRRLAVVERHAGRRLAAYDSGGGSPGGSDSASGRLGSHARPYRNGRPRLQQTATSRHRSCAAMYRSVAADSRQRVKTARRRAPSARPRTGSAPPARPRRRSAAPAVRRARRPTASRRGRARAAT